MVVLFWIPFGLGNGGSDQQELATKIASLVQEPDPDCALASREIMGIVSPSV